MEVYIDNRQREVSLDDDIKEAIEMTIEECLKYENMGTNYEVSVSLVNNKEIKDLNSRFRNKDSATDVLSFPMDDDSEIEGQIPLLGDIIISVERAKEQALEFGHSLKREMAYLTAHSMLHLMGYDHMDQNDKEEMRSKEKDIMKNIKIFKN